MISILLICTFICYIWFYQNENNLERDKEAAYTFDYVIFRIMWFHYEVDLLDSWEKRWRISITWWIKCSCKKKVSIKRMLKYGRLKWRMKKTVQSWLLWATLLLALARKVLCIVSSSSKCTVERINAEQFPNISQSQKRPEIIVFRVRFDVFWLPTCINLTKI